MQLLTIKSAVLTLILILIPKGIWANSTSVIKIESLVEQIKVGELPPTSNGPMNIEISQQFFNKVLEDVRLNYSDKDNFSLTVNAHDSLVFHITSLKGVLTGMVILKGSDFGYKISYDKELKFEQQPKEELVFTCGDGHNHSNSSGLPRPVIPIPNGVDVKSLSSDDDATNLVYLDFDGESSLPGWSGYGATARKVPDTLIYKIWKSMAEDYIPFDVNITTDRAKFDAHPELNKSYVVYAEFGLINWRGVAHYSSFGTGEPVLVDLPDDLNNLNAYLHRTGSHEVGHALSLKHDGGIKDAYYSGHGEWTPIMGTGDRTVSHWSKGDYPSSTNTEDDIEIITSFLGPRLNTDSGILDLVIDNNIVSSENNFGEIISQADKDTVQFELSEDGNILLRIDPKYGVLSNLDVTAKIFDSNWNLIKESSIVRDRGAFFDEELVSGRYYIEIDGGGELSTSDGFNDYGSFGKYVINGKIGYLNPEVDFSISKQNGCIGTTIELENQSIGSELSYQWEFVGANQSTSQLENPSVSFAKPGIYPIKLTIVNKLGYKSISRQVHVGDIPVQLEFPNSILDTNMSVKISEFTEIENIVFQDLEVLNDSISYYEFCAINSCYEVEFEQLFEPETCGATLWKKGRNYKGGEEVYHNGVIYKTAWWVNNVTPGEGSPWSKMRDCLIEDEENFVEFYQLDSMETLLRLTPVEVGLDQYHLGEICVSGEPQDDVIVSLLGSNLISNDSEVKITQNGQVLEIENTKGIYSLELYDGSGDLVYKLRSNQRELELPNINQEQLFFKHYNVQNKIETMGIVGSSK